MSKYTREDIQRVMEEVPGLNDFGIGVYCGYQNDPAKAAAVTEQNRAKLLNSVDAVNRCCAWLSVFRRRVTINPNHSSYGLKHVAEKDIGYITNGVFITAAILSGFPYKVIQGGPNVAFGISERSIRDTVAARRARQGAGR